MVAPLLCQKRPQPGCYGRGGSLSARERISWGDLLKTDEQRQHPTTGSAFAGMMSSPARGGKRRNLKLNNLDDQLSGDWWPFNALVDLMRKEACGLLVVRRRLRPVEAVPGGAHCHPIPISHTRAHCERTERPSSFLPPRLLDLFGLDKDHPFELA